MTYYIRENVNTGSILSPRRPIINEFFLSSYTMSIYVGCEFGCPYCDGWVYSARPLNETVRVPLNLPQVLAEELTHIDRGDLVAITALSDPYQPVEQTYRITRQALQVFADVGQPCLVLTKGVGILEDIPILQRINEQSLAIVMTTLLTVDRQLAERLEQKSPPPLLRLDMLATLKRAGIPVGVALLPVMPFINDTSVMTRNLLRACAEVGVDFVVWDYLHIPDAQHHARIHQMLARVGNYPNAYYQDIYANAKESLPDVTYRAERDAEIITRCDGLGIEIRAPHRLYAGRLHIRNEVALLLRHAAFRDAVQGRAHMASLHRDLAKQIYDGNVPIDQLRTSPLWLSLQPLLEQISMGG